MIRYDATEISRRFGASWALEMRVARIARCETGEGVQVARALTPFEFASLILTTLSPQAGRGSSLLLEERHGIGNAGAGGAVAVGLVVAVGEAE